MKNAQTCSVRFSGREDNEYCKYVLYPDDTEIYLARGGAGFI